MKKRIICRLTERGQVTVPASIRKELGLSAGGRVMWEHDTGTGAVSFSPVRTPMKGGAMAALGFAARFRQTRFTSDWLQGIDNTDYAEPAGGWTT